MSIKVSRLLRLALEDRFFMDFNVHLAAACADFGIPDLAYQINFGQVGEVDKPQNFYRGNRTLDQLSFYQEPELPALTMWTGPGAMYGPGQREMPRNFSGYVTAWWRFFLSVKGRSSSGLPDLREATESAMVTTLGPEFAEVTFRGDLSWAAPPEQVWLDQDERHVGFVQEIEFQASFEVNV